MSEKPRTVSEFASSGRRTSRGAKSAKRTGESFPREDVKAAMEYVQDALLDRDAEIVDLRAKAETWATLSVRAKTAEAERDAARAELDRATKARDRALASVKSARAERDENGTRLEQVQDELADERATTAKLKDQIEEHRQELELLRMDLLLAKRAAPSAPPASPDPPSATQAAPSEALLAETLLAETPTADTTPRITSAKEITDPVAHAFLTWCQKGGGLVGRVGQFQTFLAQRMPGAEVTRIDRDADSPVRPIRLRPGGVSPVEHWVVSFEGRAVLLPHPLGPGQFREIGPCFEGHATPATLKDIIPAALRSTGSDYELVTPGRVEG